MFYILRDEIGLIPCPEARYNRSPIVLVENKLGVESWCVKFLLPYVHNKLLLYRMRKQWLNKDGKSAFCPPLVFRSSMEFSGRNPPQGCWHSFWLFHSLPVCLTSQVRSLDLLVVFKLCIHNGSVGGISSRVPSHLLQPEQLNSNSDIIFLCIGVIIKFCVKKTPNG